MKSITNILFAQIFITRLLSKFLVPNALAFAVFSSLTLFVAVDCQSLHLFVMTIEGTDNSSNLSAATYEMVKEFFDCEFRGKVAAKHKGEIDIYFVKGVRREQSIEDARQRVNVKDYA